MQINNEFFIPIDEVKFVNTNDKILHELNDAVDSQGNSIKAYRYITDYQYFTYLTYNKIIYEIRDFQKAWDESFGKRFTDVYFAGHTSKGSYINISVTCRNFDQMENFMTAIGEFLHEMFNCYFDL